MSKISLGNHWDALGLSKISLGIVAAFACDNLHVHPMLKNKEGVQYQRTVHTELLYWFTMRRLMEVKKIISSPEHYPPPSTLGLSGVFGPPAYFLIF